MSIGYSSKLLVRSTLSVPSNAGRAAVDSNYFASKEPFKSLSPSGTSTPPAGTSTPADQSIAFSTSLRKLGSLQFRW